MTYTPNWNISKGLQLVSGKVYVSPALLHLVFGALWLFMACISLVSCLSDANRFKCFSERLLRRTVSEEGYNRVYHGQPTCISHALYVCNVIL